MVDPWIFYEIILSKGLLTIETDRLLNLRSDRRRETNATKVNANFLTQKTSTSVG